MTNNTELLSLHFKQAEKGGSTAWMKHLAHAIKEKLGSDAKQTLFSAFELFTLKTTTTRDSDITSLAKKLNQFLQILDLCKEHKK